MGQRGGQRAGAGRPKGVKGKLQKELAAVAPSVEAIVGSQETPLAFLLRIQNDGKVEIDTRVDAAKAAAPYVHRKQPQDVNVGGAIPLAVSIITPLSAATNVPNTTNTGR